jgi:hypothetical protein
MNPELQTLVDRIELLERQGRGWKFAAGLALALAVAAVALSVLPSLRPQPTVVPTDRARYSVVEANRFLLRSPGGDVAGGLEVDGRGTIRLVLGTPRTAAAFLEVERGGEPRLSLRGEDGGTRAALTGGDRPTLSLAPPAGRPTAVVTTLDDGTGALRLTTSTGRQRFRAP